jgi:hypothetical protein
VQRIPDLISFLRLCGMKPSPPRRVSHPMSPKGPLRRALLASLALLPLALPASAQGPDARWRTIEMPHFRIHYPAGSEAWTRRAAARLEAIWARVEGEVGYKPPDVVDVVVSDPIAQANGAALPFLGWPRLILWTSPPEPESELGHYSDWSELLLVHESTHLVHLLRRRRTLHSALSK